VNIKFCYKLGKTATETHEMLVQVYGTEAVSRKCVYDWFKRFRDGKETTEDEPRSGRPSTSRTRHYRASARNASTRLASD
jgi:transposase